MKVNKLVESLNMEKGKDSRYYINWLKERGIKTSDYYNITVMAARYHLAKYGKIQGSSLIKIVEKYNLDKKSLISDVQEQIAEIYYRELEKALQEVI